MQTFEHCHSTDMKNCLRQSDICPPKVEKNYEQYLICSVLDIFPDFKSKFSLMTRCVCLNFFTFAYLHKL